MRARAAHVSGAGRKDEGRGGKHGGGQCCLVMRHRSLVSLICCSTSMARPHGHVPPGNNACCRRLFPHSRIEVDWDACTIKCGHGSPVYNIKDEFFVT